MLHVPKCIKRRLTEHNILLYTLCRREAVDFWYNGSTIMLSILKLKNDENKYKHYTLLGYEHKCKQILAMLKSLCKCNKIDVLYITPDSICVRYDECVRECFRPSIRPSLRPSVRPSVRLSFLHELYDYGWIQKRPFLHTYACCISFACQFLSKSSTSLTLIFKVKELNRVQREFHTWFSRTRS